MTEMEGNEKMKTELSASEENKSQSCTLKDSDITIQTQIHNECSNMKMKELEDNLHLTEVGGKLGYVEGSAGSHKNSNVKEQMNKDPAMCNIWKENMNPESCGKGCLASCKRSTIENDPLLCEEAKKAGEGSCGCRKNVASSHPSDKRESQACWDPSVYLTRQPGIGEMEGDLWSAEHEDQGDNLCECSPGVSYEQLPDLARLRISSSMDYMQHYPYEDSLPSEYVVMCDFVAAEETQLSLSCGDRVLLLSAVTPDWWWVEHNGNCGYAPASHLHRISNEDDPEDDDPWQDEEYYGSYKTLKLHLEMLSDQPRTETYRNVILNNSSALKGKRILDLGCGTGIISFFCAQLAQPDVVYAVEASEIAEQTRRLAEENGFLETVKVIHQKAEELKLPSKVDALVSEWMGTCLVFEFMLESVLLARDLWLEEDGIMWPSTASIHMVPCSAEKEYASKVLFWDSTYGLDFKMLKPTAVKEFLSKPKPDYVLNTEDCLSEPCSLLDLNMKTLKIEELEETLILMQSPGCRKCRFHRQEDKTAQSKRMSGPFTFHVKRDGMLHGFTTWFSVQFQNIENQGHVELNTGPFNPLTHWKHTLFMLDEPIQIHRGDRIEGSAVFCRNPFWRRHLSITLNWSITGESATTAHNVGCKVFPIWR